MQVITVKSWRHEGLSNVLSACMLYTLYCALHKACLHAGQQHHSKTVSTVHSPHCVAQGSTAC